METIVKAVATEMEIAEKCKEIWRAYAEQCETSYKSRNGIIVCNVVEPWTWENPYAKPETVAEHQGRAAYLLGLFLVWFPFLTTENTRFIRIMHMLSHDIGEIRLGDQLDDGSAKHEEARGVETEVLGAHYDHYPEDIGGALKMVHRNFEETATPLETFDKLVDKLEAVLFLIFLLSKGQSGDVTLKNPPSERDLRFGALCKTTRAVDVWCLHLRVLAKKLRPQMREPIMGVLRQAFKAVEGKLPLCMKLEISNVSL